MNTTADTLETQGELKSLRAIVEKRKVCWDVFPETVRIRESTKTVGYELVLSGIHTPGGGAWTPGCPLCKEVFEDLKRIAEWTTPREERPSIHEIEMFRPAVKRSAVRHHRSEVTLSVRILHRQQFEAPIDGCERRCLHDMEARLKELGACPREWR